MKIAEDAIVVGFDGSDRSKAALHWGASLADHESLPLVVLHAAGVLVHAQDKGVGNFDAGRATASALQIAEHGIDLAKQEFPQIAADSATSLGSASLALQEASVRARCVVLGNRGRGRISGTLLGSTAFNVSEHARCPVVVVPSSKAELPGPKSPILVGVDGSEASMRAVDRAANMAGYTGAPVTIVVAWRKATKDALGNPPSGFASVDDASASHKAGAEHFVDRARERLLERTPDAEVDLLVEHGRPDEVLAKASADAGLLVVGARGRGDLASLLLGSTSRAVLHRAKCPVTIVR